MTVLQRPSGALQVCNLFWIHVLVYAFLMHSTSDQRARSTGKGRGMNFRTRLAKLERWLVPRCRALRVLEFTSMDNLYISQTWVNALVVVIETAHASLRAMCVLDCGSVPKWPLCKKAACWRSHALSTGASR